ncbi:putative reverse transcriptase domain-containing protein [Tanacetum coccineum]
MIGTTSFLSGKISSGRQNYEDYRLEIALVEASIVASGERSQLTKEVMEVLLFAWWPREVMEVLVCLLGLTGYYRRFIQDFSNIASSLTKLTRKNTPFEWGREQEEAFTTLRKKLCEAPILLIPEGTEDMVVYSDASYSGLGCVLMQWGKATQDRWKSYADNRRKPIELNVGDFVMLKVSPCKGVLRFKNKGKLSPRFIGPFKILKRVGECLTDETSVITLDDVEIYLEIITREEPVVILGRKSRQLRNKEIPLAKVMILGTSGVDKSKEKK